MLEVVRKLALTYRTIAKPSVVWNGPLKLRISPGMHPEIVRGIYKNGYERGEIALLRETLRRGDVVLDLGAGIGQSAIFSALKTGRKVYAVEANPDLIPLIGENARLNRVDVEVIHGAVGASDGTAEFYVASKFFESSLTPFPAARKVTVPKIGIKTLIEKVRPTYLNVDVEGAEYDVLPLVTKSDVRCISVEVHDPNRTPAFIKTMAENGFSSQEEGSLLHLR